MKTEFVRFPGSQGASLAAYIDRPGEAAPNTYALFAHCFTCSKNLRAVRNISLALTRHGIGLLRFDFTGLGESDGDFADANFSSNVGDLSAAADYMEENGIAPGILIGHSLGGAAALYAGSKIDSCKAVVTIASPSEPLHVTRHFTSKLEEIDKQGVAQVNLAGRAFSIKKQFIEDLEAHRMRDVIGNLRRALLVFHSPIDAIVDIRAAAEIFAAAKHPKSFISLDGADHVLSDAADSQYVGAVIAAWADRYV